mgnify:CR=1 FL=1
MWTKLTIEQQTQFKDYCNQKYGNTFVFCETGEPMYFDEQMRLINLDIVYDLLFNNNLN